VTAKRCRVHVVTRLTNPRSSAFEIILWFFQPSSRFKVGYSIANNLCHIPIFQPEDFLPLFGIIVKEDLGVLGRISFWEDSGVVKLWEHGTDKVSCYKRI